MPFDLDSCTAPRYESGGPGPDYCRSCGRHRNYHRDCYVFRAATSASAFCDCGRHVDYHDRILDPFDNTVISNPHYRNRSQAVDTRTDLERDLERTLRRADRLQARIDMMAARPEEPEFEDGDLPVVRFDLRFNGSGQTYSYAAIKTGAGWYTTGPDSPKMASWDALMSFIERHTLIGELWLATEWTVV